VGRSFGREGEVSDGRTVGRSDRQCRQKISVETESSGRQTECPVCGKEAVSLKNTDRFVQEHNCSSDEAHL